MREIFASRAGKADLSVLVLFLPEIPDCPCGDVLGDFLSARLLRFFQMKERNRKHMNYWLNIVSTLLILVRKVLLGSSLLKSNNYILTIRQI